MINFTPKGELKSYLLGDLALARRHCERIMTGVMMPNLQLVGEIRNSLEDCVARIERDMKDEV